MDQNRNFHNLLVTEFERRKKTNPRFSLRKYAEQLNLNASFLSKILSNKRAITIDFIVRVGPLLNLNRQEIENQKILLLRSKLNPRKSVRGRKASAGATLNELDFLMIESLNEWIYFAVLELFSLKNFSKTKKDVARLLRITEDRAEHCINKLVEKGLLVSEGGKLAPANMGNTIVKKPFTSSELVNIQKQFLIKSLEALQNTSLDQRDHSGVTIAISSSQIEKAKKLIKDFRRKFIQTMEKKDPKDSVYQLAVSFFPLTD